MLVLFGVRLWAARYSAIADCDETFNYWEPTHFLAFGRGFQTWEYSPAYALRSYLFLLPHTAASHFAAELFGRPAAFFAVRSLQACVAVLAEGSFVLAVSRRFGPSVGRTLAWFLAMSPGMYVAAVAFLPSSIATLLVCLIWALWLSDRFASAIFLGMAAVVVVWPFTGLLFVPLGLHALWKCPVKGVLVAIVACLFWAALSTVVDSQFYGRTVLPSWEIIRYNVLDRSKKGGPELYGVEPWFFYIMNGFLNLTLSLPLAAGLPIVLLGEASLRSCFGKQAQQASARTAVPAACLYCAAAFLWFAFFSTIPHKEERFLAPAYPLILLAAAVVVHGALGCVRCVTSAARFPASLRGAAVALTALVLPMLLLGNGLVSFMRIATLHEGYSAPVHIYASLSKELVAYRNAPGAVAGRTNVCIGGEWHRFMTSFFLPHADDHLAYITFGPTGLLPAEFNTTLGTSGVPPHMNDLNQEETSRYIDRASCDFLVDLDLGEESGDAVANHDVAALRQEPGWRVVEEVPFLNAGKSRFPWRAFNVPGVSSRKNSFASYRLLKRGGSQ